MNSGSYQLTVRIRETLTIIVGGLGSIRFERGDYIYTGSAMRGLAARVARHRRTQKTLRWHIDYLLADPRAELIAVDLFPSAEREECDRNLELITRGASVPIIGFGSSDCRRCPAHLVKTN